MEKRRNSLVVLCGMLVMLWGTLAFALDGAEVFEAKCSACHRSASALDDVPMERLANELAEPTRRPHRFTLSAEERELLLELVFPAAGPGSE